MAMDLAEMVVATLVVEVEILEAGVTLVGVDSSKDSPNCLLLSVFVHKSV